MYSCYLLLQFRLWLWAFYIYFVVGFCSVPAQTVQWHSLGKGAIVLESEVFRQRDSCFGILGKFQNCASFSSGKICIAVFTFPPIVLSFCFVLFFCMQ